MNLDEMSDSVLACDCQMRTYWLQPTSVEAARLVLVVIPKLCTPIGKTLENLTENLHDSVMKYDCIYLNWNYFLFGDCFNWSLPLFFFSKLLFLNWQSRIFTVKENTTLLFKFIESRKIMCQGAAKETYINYWLFNYNNVFLNSLLHKGWYLTSFLFYFKWNLTSLHCWL